MRLGAAADQENMSLGQKLWQVSWSLVLLFCVTAAIGFAMLYSAAGGALEPWTLRQVARFGVSIMLMLAVAVTDIRIWLRYAYLFYFLVLVLLVAVELIGIMGMGAVLFNRFVGKAAGKQEQA